MEEYIERSELESILRNRYYKLAGLRPDFYAGYMMAFHTIEDDVPTAADVVEVRHAKWVSSEQYNGRPECSACFYVTDEKTNYCPHCGALMDKEE